MPNTSLNGSRWTLQGSLGRPTQSLIDELGRAQVPGLGSVKTAVEVDRTGPGGAAVSPRSPKADLWLGELSRAGTGPKGIIDETDLAYLQGLSGKRSYLDVLFSDRLAPLLGGSGDRIALKERVLHRVETLEAQKAAAKERAQRDVAAYTEDAWRDSYFRPDEAPLAVRARAKALFERNHRRLATGTRAQLALLEQMDALEAELTKVTGDKAAQVQRQLDKTRRAFVELDAAMALNARIGVVDQGRERARRFLSRGVPVLGIVDGSLRRSGIGKDGPQALNVEAHPSGDLSRSDPRGSTFWKRLDPKEITPVRLYEGPWWKKNRPEIPTPEDVLALAGFRSRDSDGMHPQVVVTHGGAEMKVKFYGERGVSTDAIHSRLLHALGYHTDPVVTLPSLRLDPRAVIAAYRTNQKIAGYTPWTIDKTVREVRKHSGEVVTGEEAIALLELAARRPAVLDSLESVKVENVDLELEGKGDAVGPWDYDQLSHLDQREVRALGIIFESWLGNNDIKFNNCRLDVVEKDGEVQLRHVLSDVGSPSKLDWKVGVTPDQKYLRSDGNLYMIHAFDKTTVEDAKWAIRQIGQLSEEQISACVAAGAFTRETHRYFTEKLISRRDDLVKSFGLDGELGVMRPNGPKLDDAAAFKVDLPAGDEAFARRTLEP